MYVSYVNDESDYKNYMDYVVSEIKSSSEEAKETRELVKDSLSPSVRERQMKKAILGSPLESVTFPSGVDEALEYTETSEKLTGVYIGNTLNLASLTESDEERLYSVLSELRDLGSFADEYLLTTEDGSGAVMFKGDDLYWLKTKEGLSNFINEGYIRHDK